MDLIVPLFEQKYSCRVDVIASGTGNAIRLGERGDVDVLLVHAPDAEQRFMASGHGATRKQVMYNTFEMVGPRTDPAEIRDTEAIEGLRRIAAGKHRFVSRGDDSGTHKRELSLWEQAGGRPEWDGYIETGQGMGATLVMASQMQAYTLSDRGTYLAFRDKIALEALGAPGEHLVNHYGVITVNPDKNDQINYELANAFVEFLISADIQKMIGDFKIHDESLFHPLHLPE